MMIYLVPAQGNVLEYTWAGTSPCTGTCLSLFNYLWEGCHEGGTGEQVSHEVTQDN